MRGLARQVVSWVAIYAVALHVILLGLVPIAANGAAVDPFSVICHSASAGARRRDAGKARPDPRPRLRTLQSVQRRAAAAAPDIALIGNLMPTRLMHVLRPASQTPRAGIAFRPNLARGPPSFA